VEGWSLSDPNPNPGTGAGRGARRVPGGVRQRVLAGDLCLGGPAHAPRLQARPRRLTLSCSRTWRSLPPAQVLPGPHERSCAARCCRSALLQAQFRGGARPRRAPAAGCRGARGRAGSRCSLRTSGSCRRATRWRTSPPSSRSPGSRRCRSPCPRWCARPARHPARAPQSNRPRQEALCPRPRN